MGFFENLGELNVKLLKRRGDIDGLIKVLETGRHPESREEAAEALGEIRDPRAVDPLIAALRDRNSEVRAEAAEATREDRRPEGRGAADCPAPGPQPRGTEGG